MQYAQGDILIVRIDGIPVEGRRLAAENGRLILARGEVTGHHHSVAVADAELVEAAEAVYLRIMRATPLEHQEHAAITLEPGIYEVRQQREYHPAEIRRVAD